MLYSTLYPIPYYRYIEMAEMLVDSVLKQVVEYLGSVSTFGDFLAAEDIETHTRAQKIMTRYMAGWMRAAAAEKVEDAMKERLVLEL